MAFSARCGSAFLKGRSLYVVIGAVIVAITGGLHGAHAQDRVRVGIQIGAHGTFREALPQIEGKYNLKFEMKDFRDSTAAMLALEQGELDIANTTAQHLVRAIEENISVVWVAGWGGGNNVLIAAKTLSLAKNDWTALARLVKRRADEKNPLKIGVPTGSMQHLKLLVALREGGLDPSKDVQIVNIPFPIHPRAIDAGEVDLAMTLAPFGAISIHGGNATLFAHIYGEKAGRQEIGFIVQRDTMVKRPEYLQRVVAAYVEAMKMFMSDTNKQIALELKYLRLPEPVVTMTQRDFLRLNYRTNIPDLRLMARQMYEIGWAKKDHSAEIERYVDFTVLEKVTGEKADTLKQW